MRKFMMVVTALAVMAVPATAMASPAKDTTYTTTTGDTCADGPKGSVTVSKGIATINVPTAASYGIIRAFPVNLKVKDIKTLSFKSNSTAPGHMV
jgi:hypothetical protein